MSGLTLPRGERQFVLYCGADGTPLFVLTAKAPRDFYYLYEVTCGTLKKLGRDRSPKALEERFPVRRRMGVKPL